MHAAIHYIETLSAWVGKAFAWCILVLTLGTTYEVVMRYAFCPHRLGVRHELHHVRSPVHDGRRLRTRA